MSVIVKTVNQTAGHIEHVTTSIVDSDGFQTVTRTSSQKAHASSSNGQIINHKMDNHSSMESGKQSNENPKYKENIPLHKEYRPVQKKNLPHVTPPQSIIPPKGASLNRNPPLTKPKNQNPPSPKQTKDLLLL